MTSSAQYWCWVSRIRLRAASATLPLVVILVLSVVATPSAQAQTFTVLYTFAGFDGANPAAPLVRDAAGNLYGTTYQGGSFNGGTVFKVDKARTETILLNFEDGIGGSTGSTPSTPVIRDAFGNLYGVALEGPGGAGVVYKLTPSGKEKLIFAFQGCFQCSNPGVPESGLLMDKAGNLYGTTIEGGDSQCSVNGNAYCGTVFKLAKNGKLTVLYSFRGGSDGAAPFASLIMDKAGNLYGTTYVGGDLHCTLFNLPGCGVVFKLDPAGKETVLHAFTGGADGAFPGAGGAGLVEDAAGNLYGAAPSAGDLTCFAPYGCGTIFKVDTSGKFKVLHTFKGGLDGGPDGVGPNAGLILDPAGNLYGTTSQGGDLNKCPLYGCGVVYKLDKRGVLTVLHTLNGNTDGGTPAAGLVRDEAGNLYGTAYQFGPNFGAGTVFKLTP